MIKVGRIRLLGNALCALVLLLLTLPVSAQVGGDNTYDFLNIPNSARISSNGGGLVSINDADINLAVYNPGLIDSSLHGQLSLGYVDYFSDINAGIAAYAHHFQKAGTFLASMQYLHYGSFTETDEMGNIRGEFTAADYALGIGWAYHPDTNFTFGATWKTIYSSYFDYTSSGMALDIAATYTSRKRQFCATLLARNAGFQLTPYYEGHSEPLPFELQLGFSKKLKKAPLRIIGALTHLEKFDLTWQTPGDDGPKIDAITGDTLPERKFWKFADKLTRHALIGVEFVPSQNFYINISYNYRRRQELKVDTKPSTMGFSWGLGFRVYKFHLSYARAAYHLAGATNFFTISSSIGDFVKKQN